MDIHKPKPVHSFKAFLGEIGVVVLGISIALTAEAGIEALHWRAQIREAHEALATDLAQVIKNASERDAFSACVGRHLDRWADMVEEAARTGRIPPQGAMHRAPPRLWLVNSWDGLVAAGIAPHLPRDELVRISLIAHDLKTAEEIQADEDVQWTRLYTMVGPGRAADAGEVTALRSAVSRARADAKSLRQASLDLLYLSESTKLVPKDLEKRIRDDRTKFAGDRCVPDEPVPARYGDGPPAGQPLDRPLGR